MRRRCPTSACRLPPSPFLLQMAASYKKGQTLTYKNGYAVPAVLGQPAEPVAALQQQFADMWTIPAVPAPTTSANSTFTPKYVQFDKQVSCGGL